MRKIKYKKGRKIVPNILEYTGNHEHAETEMQLFVYNEKEVIEIQDIEVNQINQNLKKNEINWLNIHGLNIIENISKIGQLFAIDHFIISDVLNTTKRTKIEEFNDMLFFNVKSLLPVKNSNNISSEQISFILKDSILISFQEKRSDFFTHIRERIRTNSGIVRTKKADYLLYLLLDAIIENFYITIENEEDKMDEVINLSKSEIHPHILELLENHRDNFNFLKRNINPLRDSLYSIKLIKEDNVFNEIEDENYSFFSRLHQKCLELLEQIEYDLITLDSASNYFFSVQNHKMNQVMKTLTIVSVVFMPLTFIVGIYGMNFENLPELKLKYGYYYVLGFMLFVVLSMILYFKKKKWF